MSCDFKSTAYLSHRLKGSWIKNHAITIHAGYGLRVQFSEHICVLRAIFPTIKKKGQKSMPHLWRETAALWAKKFSSVHAIKFKKKNAMWKKRGWNAYFLKETYEMLIISFQPPPAKKKKKWSKSDLIVNWERMCCRWLWLRRFDFLSGSYYPSQVHVLSIQRYRVSNRMVIVTSWSWNFYLDGLL